MRPPELCFSEETKRLAKERAGYRCQECGKYEKDGAKLEIHHRVAIWFAQEIPCLAPMVIASLANSVCLCQECHAKRHDPKTESRTKYAEEAKKVVTEYLDCNLRPERDDWRKDLVKNERNHWVRPSRKRR